jgi:hypothetical protein
LKKREKKWVKRSDEFLLDYLRDLAEELGRPPGIRDLASREDAPGASVYFRRFDSYRKALKEALDTPVRGRYNCSTALRLLRNKARELGRAPTAREMDTDKSIPGTAVYCRCFGSFRTALRRAECSPEREYSNEQLISMLDRKIKELGRFPTSREIDTDPQLACSALYFKRFKSLTRLALKLGVRPTMYRCSNAEMIRQLREKAKRLGHPPSEPDLEKDRTLPSPNTFRNRFGSLERARSLAGCPTSRVPKKYTDEELIELLNGMVTELGRMPLRTEVDMDERMPSSCVYSHRFGNWQEITKKIRHPGTKRYIEHREFLSSDGSYDRHKIIERFREKSMELQRFPMREEVDQDPTLPCSQVVIQLFGSLSELARIIRVLPRPPGHPAYTKEILSAYLRSNVKKLGRVPTEREISRDKRMPGYNTFKTYFGSFETALAEIGEKPSSRRRQRKPRKRLKELG